VSPVPGPARTLDGSGGGGPWHPGNNTHAQLCDCPATDPRRNWKKTSTPQGFQDGPHPISMIIPAVRGPQGLAKQPDGCAYTWMGGGVVRAAGGLDATDVATGFVVVQGSRFSRGAAAEGRPARNGSCARPAVETAGRRTATDQRNRPVMVKPGETGGAHGLAGCPPAARSALGLSRTHQGLPRRIIPRTGPAPVHTCSRFHAGPRGDAGGPEGRRVMVGRTAVTPPPPTPPPPPPPPPREEVNRESGVSCPGVLRMSGDTVHQRCWQSVTLINSGPGGAWEMIGCGVGLRKESARLAAGDDGRHPARPGTGRHGSQPGPGAEVNRAVPG